MLYSTTTPVDDKAVGADANTYRPFKILNTAITHTILEQVDSLGEADIEGKALFILCGFAVYANPNNYEEPIDLVGALTKSLCCV
jgi:transcription initiation factor TFIIH subunit 3